MAADHDQAASDRDLADGGDPDVHEASRDSRDRSAHQRRSSNQRRGEAASVRDSVASARDLAAEARDRASALLDRDLEARDADWAAKEPSRASEAEGRANINRERAEADRSAAADARTRAGADRASAAHDREQAASDRIEAQEEREALLNELTISETDALTGTRARAPGLADLDHEVDRAQRTTGLLTIAYVDVVGLKSVNDTHGHSAGDALLRSGVQTIQRFLRSYDAIIRVGGDEFLCVMPGAAIENVRQRFDAVEAALASDSSSCRIKVGIAALGPDESATDLIDRADAALPASPE